MLTIRAARLNRGLTLADLASRLGVSASSVAEAERRDAAGTITLSNRARYLAAMGLVDAVVTVQGDADQLQHLWDQTMDDARAVQESMALELQPVGAVETEQTALRSFARSLGEQA